MTYGLSTASIGAPAWKGDHRRRSTAGGGGCPLEDPRAAQRARPIDQRRDCGISPDTPVSRFWRSRRHWSMRVKSSCTVHGRGAHITLASAKWLVHERATFYFDLGSPYAYLTAERISGALHRGRSWSSRSGSRSCSAGSSSASAATRGRTGPGAPRGSPRSSAAPPPTACRRWSGPSPGRATRCFAMRAATFAKQTGRTVSFALAGFRQAFAAGRDLSEPDNVLIAAAACELHPKALLKAVGTEGVKRALREATDRAAELGVDRRPLAGRRRRGLLGRRQARGGGRGGELRWPRWPICPTPPPVTSCSRGWR